MRGKREECFFRNTIFRRRIIFGFQNIIFNERIFLVLILFLGLFLRIYHLGDFLNFFHDQGRDALVVKRIIVDHKLTLLGPQTTAPGVYLGPLYYYLMIIPLWIARLNPIGMDYFTSLIGVAAIFIIYLLAKEMFNKEIDLLVALIYSTNPIVISFSNHAWNPNLLPFFMLLTIYGIYKVFEKREEKYWLVIGVGLSCALQIHLFSIVLFPIIVASWILKRYKINKLKFFIFYFLFFIFLLLPWFLFELRHGFINTQNLYKFFMSKDIGVSLGGVLSRVKEMSYWLISQVIVIKLLVIPFCLLLFLFVILDWEKFNTKLLTLWFIFGLLIIGIYKGVFQYYHGLFLTPLPFLFYGFLLEKIWDKKLLKYLGIIFSLYLVFLNIKTFDFNKKESRLPILKRVASVIAKDAADKKFNLAGLTWRFDHNAMDYRYFVELEGKKALDKDNYQNAEILYVISEGQKENLLKSKIMEISEFKPKKIARKWLIDKNITIYKLIK